MNNQIKDRIRQLINELCSGSGSRFASLTGMSQSSVSTIVSETRGNSTYETLYKILTGGNIRINPMWLMLGEGNMLLDEKQNASVLNEKPKCNTESKEGFGIPIVTLDNIRKFSLQRKDALALSYIVSEDLRATGAECIVRISGDDMCPEVPQGSLIAIRRDNNILVSGGTYLLDMNGIYLLRNVVKEGNVLRLSSCNNKYPEQTVEYKKVHCSFLKVAVIKLS